MEREVSIWNSACAQRDMRITGWTLLGPNRPANIATAPEPPPPQQHDDVPHCRMCWEEADGHEGDALLTPCLCSGSLRHVHERCLREWLLKGDALLRCNVCRADYDLPPGFQLPRPAELAAELLQQAGDEVAEHAGAQRPFPRELGLLLLGVVVAMVVCPYVSVWRARHNYRQQVLQRQERWRRLEEQLREQWQEQREQWRRRHAESWARMRARHEECVRELPRLESQLRWRRLARQACAGGSPA